MNETKAEPELTDVIERLAGLSSECSCMDMKGTQCNRCVWTHYVVQHSPFCNLCNGTGTAERFPSLRFYAHENQQKCSASCTWYYPVAPDEIDLGALLVEVRRQQDERMGFYVSEALHHDFLFGEMETPTEAVLRAIHQALQTETSPVPNDLPKSPD